MRNRELIKAARELVEEDTEAVIRRHRDECCCPNNVTYVIFTNCLTINNGSCANWDFCEPEVPVCGNTTPLSKG
ncbi:MAG TPA: hypothetical protein PLR82_01140 [Bacillota bacterium]|jgi:hypothetical protein|nr:hypothetical protein [Candidatus Fermentithermobacillaceae bacterium]HAF66392.1 hypothetical protein [Clostridiales bacterium UBA9857]HOA70596.1 hypothetical protein [Bacillota bacterium]HOP71080.1 hypothetical protein [Bacillota bacterium]HPZ84944.1 hypothetical protein [Bacillota bacterium]